jgi:DNA-binding transcriptional regulator WhiA
VSFIRFEKDVPKAVKPVDASFQSCINEYKDIALYIKSKEKIAKLLRGVGGQTSFPILEPSPENKPNTQFLHLK